MFLEVKFVMSGCCTRDFRMWLRRFMDVALSLLGGLIDWWIGGLEDWCTGVGGSLLVTRLLAVRLLAAGCLFHVEARRCSLVFRAMTFHLVVWLPQTEFSCRVSS